MNDTTQILTAFEGAGAQRVAPDILQPADTLLDLYGESIRARAYVTNDPLRGEMMLRPDFTVPVVQAHMRDHAEPARYCYAGPVFRISQAGSNRPSEYTQVGYEVFDNTNPAGVEGEVFALFHRILTPLALQAHMGDVGLIRAAVMGLTTSEARKSALLRHIWRPHRFRALLARFSEPIHAPSPAQGGPQIGLRSDADVKARLDRMAQDAETPPIPATELAALNTLLDIDAPPKAALEQLEGVENVGIGAALNNFRSRLQEFEKQGLSLDDMRFQTTYGLTSMEYYDGFVFGFHAADPDLPPVASGGRYDALTRVLGQGRDIPAVGGVIRPELTAKLGGLA